MSVLCITVCIENRPHVLYCLQSPCTVQMYCDIFTKCGYTFLSKNQNFVPSAFSEKCQSFPVLFGRLHVCNLMAYEGNCSRINVQCSILYLNT